MRPPWPAHARELEAWLPGRVCSHGADTLYIYIYICISIYLSIPEGRGRSLCLSLSLSLTSLSIYVYIHLSLSLSLYTYIYREREALQPGSRAAGQPQAYGFEPLLGVQGAAATRMDTPALWRRAAPWGGSHFPRWFKSRRLAELQDSIS